MSHLNNNDLHRIFKDLDQDGDGMLSVDEINWFLERIGVPLISLEEVESLVGKSILNLDDFLLFYNSVSTKQNKDKGIEEVLEDKQRAKVDDDLVEAFNVFDFNRDGFISGKEIENVLLRLGLWGDNGKGKDAASMIRKFDTNFDGLIDLEEFRKMISK